MNHSTGHETGGTVLTAVVVCGISGSALLGWVLGMPELKEVLPGSTPMHVDSAAAMLASGVALLLALRPGAAARGSAFVGLLVLGLALAALAQRVGANLSLGGATLGAWLPSQGARPSPIPPNVGIALALVGAALAAGRRFPSTAAMLGGVSGALGAGSLLGSLASLGTTLPVWGVWSGMPPATAVCLVLLGGRFAVKAFRGSGARPSGFRAGPVVASLVAGTLTLLFWQALVEREDAQFRSLVRAGARGIQGEVESRLAMRGRGLAILAREWEARFFRTRGRWESDVRLLVSQSPGLVAVEWIEADGAVNWIYPEDVPLPAPDAEFLVVDASTPSAALFAGPLFSARDVPAFRILAPLLDSDEVKGWLAGTYAAPTLFSEILANVDPSFAVSVLTHGGRLLFQTESAGSDPEQPWVVWRRLRLPGTMKLVLRVEPSDAMIAAAQSPLPGVLLAGGLALSLLLGLALFLRDLVSSRAQELDREAHAHQEAAEEVRRLNLQLEERVRARTAALDRSNQELRQFASFLSHELRQPLSTQAVWADVLATHHSASLDDEAGRCVSALREGAQHMGELIESQLALAAIHCDDFEARPVDMTALARDVARDFKPDLDNAGARIEIEPLPVVRGDAQQLRQLIRNLVENAIKYRSPDRPLELRLTGEDNGEQAVIRACDNGRGFEPSDCQRIFEVGVRLAPHLASGDGMGLALCQRIAARHGGSIRARGRAGEGAEIAVSLPGGADTALFPEAPPPAGAAKPVC